MRNDEVMSTVYTIGYGTRSLEAFLDLLKRENITYLIDVRSKPYSQYQPNFSRDQLAKILKTIHIQYVFMGDLLGGRPKDVDCYTDGKVDYAKCRTKPFYKQGIDRIKDASRLNLCIALMCSEVKPQECHRSKLIGESLIEEGVPVSHIDEEGRLISQQDVIERLVSGKQLGLLGPIEMITTSRKRYLPKTNDDQGINSWE